MKSTKQQPTSLFRQGCFCNSCGPCLNTQEECLRPPNQRTIVLTLIQWSGLWGEDLCGRIWARAPSLKTSYSFKEYLLTCLVATLKTIHFWMCLTFMFHCWATSSLKQNKKKPLCLLVLQSSGTKKLLFVKGVFQRGGSKEMKKTNSVFKKKNLNEG